GNDAVQLLDRTAEAQLIYRIGSQQAGQISDEEICEPIVVVAVIARAGAANLLVGEQSFIVQIADVQRVRWSEVEGQLTEVIVDSCVDRHRSRRVVTEGIDEADQLLWDADVNRSVTGLTLIREEEMSFVLLDGSAQGSAELLDLEIRFWA